MRSFWGMAEEKREDKRKNSEPEARAGKKHKSDRDRSRDRPKGSREHDRSDRDPHYWEAQACPDSGGRHKLVPASIGQAGA